MARPQHPRAVMTSLSPAHAEAVAGLYLHVPFCSHICHYCDFAKTARYGDEQVSRYFATLGQQLAAVLARLPHDIAIDTVFVGGGTPSLFREDYGPLFAQLNPALALTGVEATIEVNPLHATRANLKAWREAGFNRISLGVQSFHDDELATLTRKHRRAEAVAAVNAAREQFDNVSVDLIYGLPGQTEASWRQSIATAVDLGVQHLSMYTLTYEGNTVFNRRKKRLVMKERSDDALAALYHSAREEAAKAGFEHYEVSNWAKPGRASRHNIKYWQMGATLALGTGAHGFLTPTLDPSVGPAGLRYAFAPTITPLQRPPSGVGHSLGRALAGIGAEVEDGRSANDYITEAVLCSIRTREGVAIGELERRAQRAFAPTPRLEQALNKGLLHWQHEAHQGGGRRLVFAAEEWYREYSWAHEVLAGFETDESQQKR